MRKPRRLSAIRGALKSRSEWPLTRCYFLLASCHPSERMQEEEDQVAGRRATHRRRCWQVSRQKGGHMPVQCMAVARTDLAVVHMAVHSHRRRHNLVGNVTAGSADTWE